jgi:hypothetical protein
MKAISLLVAACAIAGVARADIQPIAGDNVVGFVSVPAAAGSNTVVTVPFEACLTDGQPGTLADLVSTAGLTAGASADAADKLIVLTTNGTDLVYYYYWNQTGYGWTAQNSVKVSDGGSVTLTPPAATNFPLARGLGFWLSRTAGTAANVYLKGQVSSAKQATPIATGLNLVGIGTAKAFTLNDSGIDWSGAFGTNAISSADKIIVCNGDGTFTQYYFYAKENPSESYAQFTNKWVESTSTGLSLPTRTIPAGQGFWYYRRANSAFTFRPDGQ